MKNVYSTKTWVKKIEIEDERYSVSADAKVYLEDEQAQAEARKEEGTWRPWLYFYAGALHSPEQVDQVIALLKEARDVLQEAAGK